MNIDSESVHKYAHCISTTEIFIIIIIIIIIRIRIIIIIIIYFNYLL